MTETMIERVARALHEKMCEQDVNGYLAAKLDVGALARAAIEEIREPTDKMTFRGQENRYDSAWSIGAIYRTMIDAALNEVPA